MKKRLLSVLLIVFFVAAAGWTQEFTLSGKVLDEQDQPVLFATVFTKDASRHTLSDEEGFFSLRVPRGQVVIVVSSMGYSPLEQPMRVDKDSTDIVFRLQRLTLSLDEVVVSARATESNAGTSVYEIGEQAIQQVQAMHLGDILSLLPGRSQTPANLTSVQQANLRTAAPSVHNNFGTAIIVDDAVINNDANMQATNPASSLAGGHAVVGRGVDLRAISAASIEKVEVITGVPSPRHGNITSGAILVQSRVGRSPLMVSANMTPVAYQFAGTQGLQLPNAFGYLNVDASYTYSDGSPIDRKDYYHNMQMGLRWRTRISRGLNWNNTMSFQYSGAYNGQRFEPEEVFLSQRTVRNNGYSLSSRGSMDLLGKLSYTLSGRIDDQFSRFKSVRNDGPLPLVTGLETGTFFTTYSPIVYDQETVMKGLPINFNARLEADQSISAGKYMFNFNTGTQYNYNKNRGSGRVVAGTVAGIGGVVESRSAAFHEIPASTALSLYHETDIRRVGDISRYRLRLGGRYDYMDQRYHLFSPRLSFSAQFFDRLRLRAAYGIAYKAPAMIQLYPGPAYQDYTNLSFFATNPLERMAIVSTAVFRYDNDHLVPSRGVTRELGLDWEADRFRLRTTFFRRDLFDGIAGNPTLLILERQRYQVVDRPPDRQPIVVPDEGNVDYLLRTNNVMTNIYDAVTDGIELVFSPPTLELTNTDFNLRYSYMKTTETSRRHRLRLGGSTVDQPDPRYGVYENPYEDTYRNRGDLTIIQHIPSIRLVFTINVELNFESYRVRRGASLYPFAYYDSRGNYHEIPEERRQEPEFAALKLPESTYQPWDMPPFHTNFHLQVRKETKSGHSFSFYANNVFWYNPEYTFNDFRRYHNDRVSFGFGVSFRLLD